MNNQRDLCERTFQFAIRIVRLCQAIEKTSGVCKNLSKQLFDAGTSIGANIEEAQGGQSRADFLSKIAIARKEAREAHYWLRLLNETKIVPQKRLIEILNECDELIAILTTIVKKTKGVADK